MDKNLNSVNSNDEDIYKKAFDNIVEDGKTPAEEDRLLHLLATSNENFINRLEEIERPDNIANIHLKTANVIRSQFGPLVDLEPAYQNKEDLKFKLDRIRSAARLNDNYAVLAASYAPTLYLPYDQVDADNQSEGMYFCFNDLLTDNYNTFQILKYSHPDYLLKYCISNFHLTNVVISKLAFKCLNEPSVNNLWLFHYLWILHDFMHAPLGHYQVSNRNPSLEIKYGGPYINCGFKSWCHGSSNYESADIANTRFHESDIPWEYHKIFRDTLSLNNIKYREHISLIHNFSGFFLLIHLLFGREIYAPLEGNILAEEFDLLKKVDSEDELIVKIKQLFHENPRVTYPKHNLIMNISANADILSKCKDVKGFIKEAKSLNINNLPANFNNDEDSNNKEFRFNNIEKQIISEILEPKIKSIDVDKIRPSMKYEIFRRILPRKHQITRPFRRAHLKLTAIEFSNFRCYKKRTEPHRIDLRKIILLFGGNSGGKSTIFELVSYFSDVLLNKSHPHKYDKDKLIPKRWADFKSINYQKNVNNGPVEIKCYFDKDTSEDDTSEQNKEISIKIEIDQEKLKVFTRCFVQQLKSHVIIIEEHIFSNDIDNLRRRSQTKIQIENDDVHKQTYSDIVEHLFNKAPVKYKSNILPDDARVEILNALVFDDDLDLDVEASMNNLFSLWEMYLPAWSDNDGLNFQDLIRNSIEEILKRQKNKNSLSNHILRREMSFILNEAIMATSFFGKKSDHGGDKNIYIPPLRETNHPAWEELSNFLKDLSDYQEDYAAMSQELGELTQIKEDGRYIDIPYEQWSEEAKEIEKNKKQLAEIISDFNLYKQLFEKHLPGNLKLDMREIVTTITTHLDDEIEKVETISKHQVCLVDEVNKKTYDPFSDVGTGVSQILPCITAGISGPNRKIENLIFIAQPELHLHPDQQCNAMDAFIYRALFDSNEFACERYFLETHSEHMLLRCLRRIRETFESQKPSDFENYPNVSKDDVIVYFIENNENDGSLIKELKIASEGELENDWPDGFFDQAYIERFGSD